jgi:hypothetical protein
MMMDITTIIIRYATITGGGSSTLMLSMISFGSASTADCNVR